MSGLPDIGIFRAPLEAEVVPTLPDPSRRAILNGWSSNQQPAIKPDDGD